MGATHPGTRVNGKWHNLVISTPNCRHWQAGISHDAIPISQVGHGEVTQGRKQRLRVPVVLCLLIEIFYSTSVACIPTGPD